ncbi:hypothetical protein RND81_13G119600 [Saponaria officinalis]|uniref:DUF547 domain-containing protein n=1 Tax=Saponaria officinalis TaxID=3572 RepID=A0AAW1H002_SAPOF
MTLKDHLHQCPNKLSEEMVRCMAAVYCWLCGIVSTKADVKQPAKSCANVPPTENHASKSMVEISSMPTDKKQFSQASYAINSYSAGSLQYWRFGSLVVSANAIEHSIFCFHTTRVGRWLETILSTAFRNKSTEEKQLISLKLSIPDSQSAVCFALCTRAFSDPVLKVYIASNVKDELERAKREFLQSNIVVRKSKKVFLPKLLERVAREAGMGSDGLLKWVCENVDKKLQHSIQRCLDGKTGKDRRSSTGCLTAASSDMLSHKI